MNTSRNEAAGMVVLFSTFSLHNCVHQASIMAFTKLHWYVVIGKPAVTVRSQSNTGAICSFSRRLLEPSVHETRILNDLASESMVVAYVHDNISPVYKKTLEILRQGSDDGLKVNYLNVILTLVVY